MTPGAAAFGLSPRRLAVATIVAGWLVTFAANAPGHLSYDSVVQLEQGTTGRIFGVHPPLMAFLLGIFNALYAGTALYLLFVQSLFFASLLVIVGFGPAVRYGTTLAIVAIAASPVVLLYQGIVWKDVLFANLTALAFALAFAARSWRGPLQAVVCAASVVLAGLAALVRQNGVIVSVGVSILVALMTRPPRWGATRTVAAGILLAGSSLALIGVAANAVMRGVIDHTQPSYPEVGGRALARYDIAGILARSDGARFDERYAPGLDARVLAPDAAQHYSPVRIEQLNKSTRFVPALNGLPTGDLLRTWLLLIRQQPAAYLRHRAEVLGWMLWPPDIHTCVPVYAGVSGPRPVLQRLGLTEGLRPKDRWLVDYALTFVGGPIYRPGFYLAAAVGLGIFLAARFPRQGVVWLGWLATACAFSASWFFLGLACEFRFFYVLALAVSLTVVAITVLDWTTP